MGVVLAGSEPCFPSAPIPTLVPDKHTSVMRGPNATPTSVAGSPCDTVFDTGRLHDDGEGGATGQLSSGLAYLQLKPYNIATNSIVPPPEETVENQRPSKPFDPSVYSRTLEFAEATLSLPHAAPVGRNEVMDMLEVGRFVTIVYPRRRWAGFTSYGGDDKDNENPKKT